MSNLGMLKRQAELGGGMACEQTRPYNPTLREKLLAQKADLAQRLADVDAAISALDANPNFEEILNVVGKVY